MINFITILLAIIAIVITLYSSEDIRLKAHESEGGFLKYLFDWLDEILFKNNMKDRKKYIEDYKDITFSKKEPFNIEKPFYKYLGIDNPLWIEDAKVFWFDLTPVNNTVYGQYLRNKLAWVKIVLVIFISFFISFLLYLLANENYLNFLFTSPFIGLFLYLIFKALNKVHVSQFDIVQAIYKSHIAFLFTKTHLMDIREKTFYTIKDIEKFVLKSNENGNKIFLYTEKGKILLLNHPTMYKEALLYDINYEDIVTKLNKYLLEYKELE